MNLYICLVLFWVSWVVSAEIVKMVYGIWKGTNVMCIICQKPSDSLIVRAPVKINGNGKIKHQTISNHKKGNKMQSIRNLMYY